jgi:transcriptional regulator with XRE-family HTH domain
MAADRNTKAEIFAERARAALDRKRHADGKRWTQKDLADAVGAMPNTVNGWLNRGVLPPAPTRKTVAQALGVPSEWLDGETDDLGYSSDVSLGMGGNVREPFAPNPTYRRRLPPRAYELAYSYIEKLEKLGLHHDEIAEAERFLVDAAYNKLNTRDLRDRNEDDMLKDIRAGWEFVKEVLGSKARGL